MSDYDTALAIGQAHYQDVLNDLAAAGLPATFIQTGGMCAALQVLLDSGHTLLVTDAEDSLAWNRREHQGWGVGLYPPDRRDIGGECLAFDSAEEGTIWVLLSLVERVLRSYPGRPGTGPTSR